MPNGTKKIDLDVVFTYQTLSTESATRSVGQSVILNDRSDQQNKTHLYLRNESGQYVLHHLGKNGEPIANTELKVKLRHIWRKNEEEITLITNSEGKIELGKLDGITAIGFYAKAVSTVVMEDAAPTRNMSTRLGN